MRKILLALMSLGFVAGCGEATGLDEDGKGIPVTGEVNFSYSGAVSGKFSAVGVPQQDLDKSLADGSFAVAFRDTAEGYVGVVAYQVRSATVADMALILIEGEQEGRFGVDLDTCELECTTVIFAFDNDLEGGATDSTRLFVMASGEVNLTDLGTNLARGTFKGAAYEVLATLARLQVTNGTFSAPLLDVEPELPNLALMTAIPPLGNLAVGNAAPGIEGFDRLPAARQERLLRVLERLR